MFGESQVGTGTDSPKTNLYRIRSLHECESIISLYFAWFVHVLFEMKVSFLNSLFSSSDVMFEQTKEQILRQITTARYNVCIYKYYGTILNNGNVLV